MVRIAYVELGASDMDDSSRSSNLDGTGHLNHDQARVKFHLDNNYPPITIIKGPKHLNVPTS